MKKYYELGHITDDIKSLPYESEKAIGLTVMCGLSGDDDYLMFVPKSQIIFSEPNDTDNRRIYIPKWIFNKQDIDPNNIKELQVLGEIEF